MVYRVTRGFLTDTEYKEVDFAAMHAAAFGSVAKFEYTTTKLTLTLQNGGAIFNGYFYRFTGEEILTIPANTTTYIVVEQARATTFDPTFRVVDTIMGDDESFYRATIFALSTTTQAITRIDDLGNATSLYKALPKLFSGAVGPNDKIGSDGDIYVKYE